MSLLTPAGDQLLVRGGNAHFFTYTRIRSGGTEKIEGQTNKHEQSLGLTKSRGRYATLCIPDSIYGLTLAWVTSENSTKLLESDSSWLTVAGPYPMLPRLSAPVSGVDCPCPWFHANSLLLASLLSNTNCSLLGRVVNSFFASPSHFWIRRDFRSKNRLSGFAPKQTKESSALAAHPHSATLLWTSSHRRASVGRPVRTYLQQVCTDTTMTVLPKAMYDRDKRQKRVRDIRASGTPWWWWHYSFKWGAVVYMHWNKTNSSLSRLELSPTLQLAETHTHTHTHEENMGDVEKSYLPSRWSSAVSSWQDVAEQWLTRNMWPINVKKQNFDQACTHAKT